MMISLPALLLIVGALALVVAFNALRPRYSPAGLAIASFFAGWLTAELGAHLLLANVAVTSVLVWGGALAHWPGRLGLVLDLAAVVMLIVGLRKSAASHAVVDAAVSDLLVHDPPAQLDWRQLLFPLPVCPGEVEKLRDIPYFDDGQLRLRLDLYRRRGGDYGPAARRPVLLNVHGGAWIIGGRANQGLPMLHRFAAHGWIALTIDYRLSPRATFPDQIIDVKRALAWVRAHVAEYGGDPDFIVISGGSAGGHLASLAALTPGEPAWQPGFESADTSVAACVSFYGVYDFGDQHHHWHNSGLHYILERFVMKATLDEAPARYRRASPIAHVGPQAPPFLVVHGTCDSLVPVAEARAFVAGLRAAGARRCVYVEVPGAQHAFEVFPSLRSLHVLRGVERFATYVHDERGTAASAAPPPLPRP
jgi:acetyl esterase/lipase